MFVPPGASPRDVSPSSPILNSDRGLPLAVLILWGSWSGWSSFSTRTTFGRHVFAVGGNVEAARRAGIRVDGVRVAVFTIAGRWRRSVE